MEEDLRVCKFQGRDTLVMPAEIDEFPVLSEHLENFADELSIDLKVKTKLLIIADEIFSNISKYAYDGATGTAEISFSYDSARKIFNITFTDSGKEYNSLEAPEPDLDVPLEERQIGGLGIFMVKKMSDKISYKRENGRNILSLELKCED